MSLCDIEKSRKPCHTSPMPDEFSVCAKAFDGDRSPTAGEDEEWSEILGLCIDYEAYRLASVMTIIIIVLYPLMRCLNLSMLSPMYLNLA